MTTPDAAISHPTATPFRESRWGSHTYVWPDLESFLGNPSPKDGVHAIRLTRAAGTLTYEFYLRVRPDKALVAHFHGNAPRRENDLPMITGLGVSADLDASLFVLSDPVLGLDDTVTLGWHIGPAWLDVHPVTTTVIDHLARVTNAARVVSWGGSGGGYAALRLARDLHNCVALVWNPQTDVDRYAPDPVEAFRRAAGFPPGFAFASVPDFDLTHEDVTTAFRGAAIVLQERTDWHLLKHLVPMLTALDPTLDAHRLEKDVVTAVTDRFVAVVSHWGQGHVPPPKTVLHHLLEDLTSTRREVFDVARDAELLLAAAAALTTDVDPFTKQPSGRLLAGTDLSSDAIEIPVLTGDTIGIDRLGGVDWTRAYPSQPNSNIMWRYSLDYLGKLAVRAAEGDEAALTWARRTMESFLEHTRDDANRAGMYRIASADHAAATRIVSMLLYFKASRRHQVDDLTHLGDVAAALFRDAEWLMDDANFRANNHGLMGALALLHAAVQFAPGFNASDLWDVASSRITALVSSSFDEQGMCNENSLGYHRFNLVTYRQVLTFVSAHRPDSELCGLLTEALAAATTAMQLSVWPTGEIPPLGDSPVYPSGVESLNGTTWFRSSGMLVKKQDGLYFSLVCGAPSEIHKQMDDTSMTLRVNGVDILIDAGSYKYDNEDPFRRSIASTVGHTGLYPRGFDHVLRGEALRQVGPIRGEISCVVETDAWLAASCRNWSERGDFSVRRDVLLTAAGELVVVDTAKVAASLGGAGSVQRWVFGRELTARQTGESTVILENPAGSTHYLRSLGSPSLELRRGTEGGRPVGWASEAFGQRFPTWHLELSNADDASRYGTVLAFGPGAGDEISHLAHAFLTEPRDFLEVDDA